MTQEKYIPGPLEEKWQARWQEKDVFACDHTSDKPKYYVLEMLPYPSGNIHMGHVRNYSIGDVVARFYRMCGFNVLHPMGWDALGLPAENAAIKNNTHPAAWTFSNIDTMRTQLKRLGYSYDWNREVATCVPEYYRWEQLFFLKMLENDLIYRKKAPQNWCPDCHTVLANEQVIDGKCWRCDSQVVQKELAQWFVRITRYAEELLADLDKLQKGWPERVIAMQHNWIGKSHGAEASFPLKHPAADTKNIDVFTTRPDTLFGVTFMTLAPEHPLVEHLIKDTENEADVRAFIERIRNMDRLDRQSETLEKEGIATGAFCVHPFTGKDIPIWLGNFVLADYGTGAVMGVPAHDVRDFAFAKKYDLPIVPVIAPDNALATPPTKSAPEDDAPTAHTADTSPPVDIHNLEEAWTGAGTMCHSGQFDGLPHEEGKSAVAKALQEKGLGKRTVQYRLRDWNISRQRYWGAPIPIIYCMACGAVPEKQENLPVVLPLDVKTHDDGRSPLPHSPAFYECVCPECGGVGRRETDTMDTFVESSWYFARYADAKNDTAPFDKDIIKYWLPVDQYIGGVEHAILHLLYSRFYTKALRDLGFYPNDLDEPFTNLLTQGMVLKDSVKMSKSKGNVVDPTDMIAQYGADTVRLFCLFAAPPERDFDWTDTGIEGSFRFLNRVWRLFAEERAHVLPMVACSASAEDVQTADVVSGGVARDVRRKEHATVKKVHDDILNKYQFNTAIAAIMELVNTMYVARESLCGQGATEASKRVFSSAMGTVLTLLSPFTPHICEELWEDLGHAHPVSKMPWPTWQQEALVQDTITVVVQVNGKLRSKLDVALGTEKDELEKLALGNEIIQKHMAGKAVRKIIVVQDKLVNIVVG